jgi:hypothetical protein
MGVLAEGIKGALQEIRSEKSNERKEIIPALI